MLLSGAEILIEELIAHGVTTIFGYPGGMVLNIYDELYKNADRIEHILTAHEQGAVHAADAFARVTGKPGVVVATSGPGATNLVTGIANAYLDSVPLVAITGNVPSPLLGRDAFQEIDIIGVTQPIVKHSYIVKDIARLETTVKEAFAVAQSGRKGPVLIDIPKSVQLDTCEYSGKASTPAIATAKQDLTHFDEAIRLINSCKRPFIYCGGGVVASGTGKDTVRLSKKISAPVGLSMMGISAIPASYKYNLGMSGMHGRYASSAAQAECDLIIALGVRFSDRATGSVPLYTRNCKVVHIDIDASEIGKNVGAKVGLCGDLREVLPKLLKAAESKQREDWLAKIDELKTSEKHDAEDQFNPRTIIKTVKKHCAEDTPIATDVGQHQMWVAQNYEFNTPRTLITSGGLGAMGFGMGAAIGACIGSGRRKTVLFTSEGSFGMNLNEMATAVSQNLPLIIVLLNNGVLGMVRQWQSLFFDGRYSQTTLARKTDFPALAKAFGADSYSCDTLEALDKILANMPENCPPCLIDCKIDIDAKVYPMIPPGGSFDDILID